MTGDWFVQNKPPEITLFQSVRITYVAPGQVPFTAVDNTMSPPRVVVTVKWITRWYSWYEITAMPMITFPTTVKDPMLIIVEYRGVMGN